MRKIALNLILAVIVLSSFAIALESNETQSTSPEQNAYNWLVNKAVNGNYGNDIASTALAGIALNQVGYDSSAKKSAEWILTQKDAKNCFPKGNCQIKETALALMLLKSLSMDEADNVQSWLENAQNAAATSGKWLIEISTQSTGTCGITYELNNRTVPGQISVDKGKFPTCGNSNFFDIESCFKPGLIRSKPGLTLTLDCQSLAGETPIITLVYNSDSTYYLVKTAIGSTADLTVANGCYSKTEKGACNKEASQYANWALRQAGGTANINLYLIESYDAASISDNSLLYLSLLTKNNKYLEALKSRQNPTDNSFNKDPYLTGLSLLALQDNTQYSERVELAKKWLLSKQNKDGSWNDNARDTAMVLYSAFGNAVLEPEAVKETQTGEEAKTCNYDKICDEDLGETSDSCTDCVIDKTGGDCNENQKCETLNGETTDNCVDCECGDSICDKSEDFESCPDDCKEETAPTSSCGDGTCDSDETTDSCLEDCPAEGGMGIGTILLIILIAAILGVVGYLAYTKLKSAPEKKPSAFGPRSGAAPLRRAQPSMQAKPENKSESQLQKSLDEARKLLKK